MLEPQEVVKGIAERHTHTHARVRVTERAQLTEVMTRDLKA